MASDPSTAPAATENPLSALADVAANLFITLPESPQGKPFISREDAGSPAKLLRAMRKRLNLTQREFGVLLSPGGVSPISPSVICQLESALQSVPPALVTRAVSVTTAVQRFGDFHAAKPGSPHADAAAVLKALGPGCIDQLDTYLAEAANLPATDSGLVGEFLAIVTKRKPSTGGSRPGARGPYRKLSKLNNFSTDGGDAPSTAVPGAPTPALVDATAGTGQRCAPEAQADSFSVSSITPQSSTPNSTSSTPCSTPSSSRGSSRPRSPLGSDSASLTNEATDATSLNILMALRRLQEENDNLMQENKRLRSRLNEEETAPAEEVARGDIAMHC